VNLFFNHYLTHFFISIKVEFQAKEKLILSPKNEKSITPKNRLLIRPQIYNNLI